MKPIHQLKAKAKEILYISSAHIHTNPRKSKKSPYLPPALDIDEVYDGFCRIFSSVLENLKKCPDIVSSMGMQDRFARAW